MYLSCRVPAAEPRAQRRRFPRFEVQCRARIIIGTRHYAGYLHNLLSHTPFHRPMKSYSRLQFCNRGFTITKQTKR